MCKVLICANQKGGVAKSTSVVNLGIGLARKGKRVLLIDNDPQGSLTEALGYPEPDKLETTLANVMEWVLNEEDFDLSAGILHHEEGIDLMPDYQSAVAKWEQQTGNKAESDSMKARLQRKQQEVQERENSRQSHQHKNDRGAR